MIERTRKERATSVTPQGSWRPVKSKKKTQKFRKSHKIQKIKTIQKMEVPETQTKI